MAWPSTSIHEREGSLPIRENCDFNRTWPARARRGENDPSATSTAVSFGGRAPYIGTCYGGDHTLHCRTTAIHSPNSCLLLGQRRGPLVGWRRLGLLIRLLPIHLRVALLTIDHSRLHSFLCATFGYGYHRENGGAGDRIQRWMLLGLL